MQHASTPCSQRTVERGLAVTNNVFFNLESILNGVTGQRELLGSFDDTNNGELEGKVQKRPDLLPDGTVMAVREVVEIERPDEDL